MSASDGTPPWKCMIMIVPRSVANTSDVFDAVDAVTDRIDIFGGSFDIRLSDKLSIIHPSVVNENVSRTWPV
jgi:hypothetical protein